MKIAVIGGGPGGYVAALKAAMMGAEVTLIEKNKVGGTCLNVGCIPTKSLLACSEAFDFIKEAENFGLKSDINAEADLAKINSRKNKIVDNLVKGIEFLLKSRNVNLVNGFGKLITKNQISVTMDDGSEQIVNADKIILATGSKAIVPGMFKYDKNNVLTSDEALELTEIPKSLLIVGGGVIGCEFGQFFSKLGTKVTIVEMASHVLPFEDDDVAKQLTRAFKKQKIKIIAKDKVDSVEVNDGSVKVVLGSGKEIEAQKMLVSVGRRANTEDLGLEALNMQLDRGKIVVNEKMQTNIDNIYAIGDIVDSPLLAHVASKEALVAVENALGEANEINYKAVPRCVYTSPEVAAVGMTQKQLDEQGIEYKVGMFDFRGLGKAQATSKIQGFVKIIVDKDEKIIGASIVGAHATDLLAELTLAVHFGLTAKQLGDVIHPHPTMSEAIMEAAHAVEGKCVHAVD